MRFLRYDRCRCSKRVLFNRYAKGLEKLAKTKVTGKNVSLTHMAVGDGSGNYYTLDKSQTELVRELHRCELTLVQVDSKYPNQIIIEAAVAAEIGGFLFGKSVFLMKTATCLLSVNIR